MRIEGEQMIRSFVGRAQALLASGALAFLVVAPVAPVAQGKNLNFPDSCSVTVDASGNVTMTCGAAPPDQLNCSISGAPSGQVAANTAISLTMSCPAAPRRIDTGGSGGTTQRSRQRLQRQPGLT
jgi:hypothetical protein